MSVRPLSFLAADRPFEKAKVAILGVPLERTVSFRGGPAQAPAAIRLASDSVEPYSAIFRADLQGIGLCDLGDIDVHMPLVQVLSSLGRETEKLLQAGKFPVVLGGEHTITLGAVRGAKAALGRLQLLALDAHSDLREEYEGERVCHATVLRRSWEEVERLVIVGARSFFGGEVREPVFVQPSELSDRLDPKVPVWLSLDLDALDPSLCPGVTNPEPGGLSYREVIEVFRALQGFNVVGLDLVELAPPYDPSGVSAVTAAKLVIEAICAFLSPRI
ncbi:MAG: Arginase/agmatinase/formimionoglutamate hydrolase [Acetothermia bacterium 64_32]|nr:MAG: Arginase/agmatinase/formimionoglutamate hydrolase [Acetothermia bacterium 64_32]MBC7098116.1 agmatinase [Candidatus Bipolaricaulota bacterium]HAF71243.1 agmatinase [Candidatus Acetothermia bacterium]